MPTSMVTPVEAKKLLKKYLEEKHIHFDKLTARTVGMSDLARGHPVFVKIWGWQIISGSVYIDGIKAFAREYGFLIETDKDM